MSPVATGDMPPVATGEMSPVATGDLFSVSDVSGIPIFNVNSSGLSTFDGDVTINGGDITITKQNDAPTMTLLHDGTNPSTNDLLFKMQKRPGKKTQTM